MADRTAATQAPLFVLSFRHRDELATILGEAGWPVIAARRSSGADRRWLASGAAVAVVDARGAVAEAVAATELLAGPVGACGGALLVVVARGHSDRLGDFLLAGATQFVTSPMDDTELVAAVRFAEAQAGRGGADWRQIAEREGALGWRYDPAGSTIALAPGLAAMLDAATARPLELLRRLRPDERRAAYAAIRRLRAGALTTAFAHDMPGMGRGIAHLRREPRGGRIEAVIEPVHEGADIEIAREDGLTGAGDAATARRWIDRRLAAGRSIAAIFVSLTQFGIVNTAYGKATGDSLLRAVARRLVEAAHETLGRATLVSRIGGSDFAVITDDGLSRVELAAAQIETLLARPFVAGGNTAPLGARIAVLESGNGDDATVFLRRGGERLADMRSGRGNDATPRSETVARQSIGQLALDLRRALGEGEIETLFQPQVAIGSGVITGVEALARWRHPALGEIGAEMLFAAAERAGLGIALSDHVQEVALRAAAAWPAILSGLRLSINVTAEDVARAGFADLILRRIDASGFPRSRLTVEVTESGLIAELGNAALLLAELRTAGCRVAIDDFGTGYSSLAYLKALPLDYLKIDRALTQDIAGSVRDRIVVRGVIDMARSLGLSVIAEGVESREQADLLAQEGCQYYQGFLCAGPLTTAALEGLVGEAA
ncbi:putative bifunctional diguanylate cyclase/phosphodiesterase [Stakelama saccharophila]|uniref:GGDEF domain-containing phosphodiesterase n=1 Tax=Stakelama saccharophila TaxID=3075605 RepID=A0ABZ0B6X9_9SPHN|nr:GGDEF domain-containing phosphodiesterase [Stakelama sp. W311]WNO52982.1 GGDEF domain-containing phosphodiesterase [Stakelama sp. W311]